MGGSLFIMEFSAFGRLSELNDCNYFFKERHKISKVFNFFIFGFFRQNLTTEVAGVLRALVEAWLLKYQCFLRN